MRCLITDQNKRWYAFSHRAIDDDMINHMRCQLQICFWRWSFRAATTMKVLPQKMTGMIVASPDMPILHASIVLLENNLSAIALRRGHQKELRARSDDA